jgi:hypothetical protein
VYYTHGVPIVAELWGSVAAAMGEVASDILMAMCGQACKLPGRVASITRQQVTVNMADPQAFIDKGLIGMPLADQLILAANPSRLQSRSTVHSPDLPRRSRQLTELPGSIDMGGVSTITLPTAYEGEPYSFDMEFPDASYLMGGIGSVEADVKAVPGGPVLSVLVPTINGATLTLTLPAGLTPGTYWTDVSVAGVTYMKKTALVVKAEVTV